MKKGQPTIGDVMMPSPVTITSSQSLSEAEGMMEEEGCLHLPVYEKEKLLGIISGRDIALALSFGHSREETKVGEVCVRFPYCAESTKSLRDVLDDMISLHIGSALVMKEGELVGIFTATDSCRVLMNLLGEVYKSE